MNERSPDYTGGMSQGDSFTPPFEVGQLGRFTSELNGETDRGAALVAACHTSMQPSY
jgi:hypothetical protein